MIDTVKSKLGLGKKSKWDKVKGWAKDHLVSDKGRIAARAAGQIGANLAYNKLTGRTWMGDVTGKPMDWGKRLAVGAGGAELGDRLYQHFAKK